METIKVHLLYPCFVCHEPFDHAHSILKHLKSIHEIDIKGRVKGKTRPVSTVYSYEKNLDNDYSTHYACPSCWFHCSEEGFDTFSHHMKECHIYPANIEIAKVDQELRNKKGFVGDTNPEEIKAKEEELINLLGDLVTSFRSLFTDSK